MVTIPINPPIVQSFIPYMPDGQTGWAQPLRHPIHVGDVFTIAGQYQRRTFWQWLTRVPRQLQRFRVTA